MNKIRALFLCTSNSARSQMAEAFLRTYAGDKYEAYSAGVEPREIHPLTRKVMDEAGIDISGQYSKALKDYMGKIHFGYLITVCSEADQKCPSTFPGISLRLHTGVLKTPPVLPAQRKKNCKSSGISATRSRKKSNPGSIVKVRLADTPVAESISYTPRLYHFKRPAKI